MKRKGIKNYIHNCGVLNLRLSVISFIFMMSLTCAFASHLYPELSETLKENDKITAREDGDTEKSGNQRLVPLPHVLCTGFSTSGSFRRCFPVGCICTDGAGICNLKNKCVQTSLTSNWNNP